MQNDLKSITDLITNMHKAYIEVIDKLLTTNPTATAQDVKNEFEKGKKLTIGLLSYLSELMKEENK